ncbi:MAG TPA: hypothetical protein VIJ15_15515 [Dermatophilaceae bacterium]
MRDLPELATHDDVGGPVRAPPVHHRQSRVELFDVQRQRRGSQQVLGSALTRDEHRIVGADMFHGADLAAIPRQCQLRGQAGGERGCPQVEQLGLSRARPITPVPRFGQQRQRIVRLPERDAGGVGQFPPGRLPQRRPGQEREGHLCARRAEQVAGRSMCGHGEIIRTGATTDIEQDAVELHRGVAARSRYWTPARRKASADLGVMKLVNTSVGGSAPCARPASASDTACPYSIR